MNRFKALVNGIIALAVVGGLIMLAVPIPESSQVEPFRFYSYLVACFVIVALFFGAALVFLLGLNNFTAKFKRAYGLICTGLVLYALAQMQVPVLLFIDQLEGFWTTRGIIVLPYLIAIFSLYLGMRSFARLFGIRGARTSFWLAFLVATLAAVLSSFVPHASTPTAEAGFNTTIGFAVWSMVFIAISATMALVAKRTASILYANSMAWMYVALCSLALMGVHYVLVLLALGDKHWYHETVVGLALYIPVGWLFLRAAYAFGNILNQPALIDTGQRNFFGKPLSPKTTERPTALDVVIYTAQLASSPQAIDPIMDDVRLITSRLTPGEALNRQDLATLKATYLALEIYLTEKDPVRQFDRNVLRQHLKETLHLAALPPEVFEGTSLEKQK